MAKIVTPTVCKVVAIGKPKESTYTPGQFYHPVLFCDTRYPEGDEQAKLWKNLSGDEVALLQRGETVQLVPIGTDKHGNPKHQIVKLTPASSTGQQAVTNHHTRTMASVGTVEWSDER